MKQFYRPAAILLAAFFVLCGFRSFAQLPVGANMTNPVIVNLTPGVTYTDTKNNSTANGYLNDINQPSDDIYYKITLASPALLSASTCLSSIDTYLLLLDSSGAILASNDDNGPLCSGLQSSIQMQLAAGTYYVVSEGWYTTAGNITTSISIPAVTTGETPEDFANAIKFIFQNVNTAPVTTGILLDCGVDFTNLDNFSGSLLLDSNYVSQYTWRSIYGSLLTSQFNNQASFADFPTINNLISANMGGTLPVPFMLLNYNYQTLRPDAITAGLMYANNGQLFDTPNRTSTPYALKTVFAAAPAVNSCIAYGGYVSYVFPANLIFGNTGKTISQLKIDVGDGARLRAVSIGQAFSAQYSTSGEKIIIYQATYTDNSVFTGHSSINVQLKAQNGSPGGGEMSAYFHQGDGATVTASTPYGVKKAFLQVQLSNNHADNVIRNPLIVVEGIDYWRIVAPNDSADYNYTIFNFLSAIHKNYLDGVDPTKFLNDKIDALGYDIVFVDFQDGTDYLENSSALVQAAITWVNGHKQGGVPNVVMGLSMGGVVAKHALRTMELNNVNHNTSLFISMDSPHQGANFPLSLQALVKHLNSANFRILASTIFNFSDMYPGLVVARNILNSPASMEQLIYRIATDPSLVVDNTAHTNFYNSYIAMGMPLNCRNVAISNGSECGIGQPYGPLAEILRIRQDQFIVSQWFANVFDLVSAPYQVIGGLLTNRPLIGFGSILGVLSSRTSFIVVRLNSRHIIKSFKFL
jgi:hypothetical protein